MSLKISRLATLIVLTFACGAGNALAAEGGMGMYALGYAGPQAGYLPEPGTYGKYDLWLYRGDASISANRPLPGVGDATLNADAKIDIDLAANIFSVIHVFDQEFMGGHPALAIAVPYVVANLDLAATGVLTLPGGDAISISGSRGFSESAIGDTTIAGLV